MSAFLEGLGKIFGKVADQFQGRVERLKNEKTKLESEKKQLEGSSWDAKKAKRISIIDARIDVLNGLLSSNAKD